MRPKPVAEPKRRRQRSRAAPAGEDRIVVRMYDVGFGDAFLVRIPTTDGVKKILFDCGSVAAGTQSMDDVVKSIVNAVSDDGSPSIDVVVATHRHKDHVSGFSNRLWQTVSVKEVWMPWTEHPTDREARRIRESQARLAAQLNLALTRKLQAAVGDPALMRLQELALNALSNEAAMRTLHNGFTRPPQPLLRFLPDNAGRILETEALPGVVIHVMGPSHAEAVIRDMDPPAGKSYLRLAGAMAEGQPQVEPFLSEWAITSTDAEWQGTNLALSPDDEERLRSLNQDMDLAAAVALDKAVNGTSLMVMLQVGQAYLLFPGDAQWGTWQLVLEDAEWRALLAKTTFLKIGHHGSHNATPKEFVEELLGKDFSAMASVRPMANWPSIPKVELMQALIGRCARVIRSDEANAPLPEGFVQGDGYVEVSVPM